MDLDCLKWENSNEAWQSTIFPRPGTAPICTRSNPPPSEGPSHSIDEADWLLTQVVHDLTNQGYTNRLQLEVKLDELPE